MNTSASPSTVIHAPILNSPVWKEADASGYVMEQHYWPMRREEICPLKRKVGDVLEKKRSEKNDRQLRKKLLNAAD